MRLLTVPIFIYFGFLLILNIQPAALVEFINVTTQSSNEDIMTMNFRISCNSANSCVASGTIDIKEPLTDKLFIDGRIERSSDGKAANYRQVGFGLPRSSLSQLMNGVYKQFLMSVAKQCASNAPEFSRFTPPLSPRKITLNNCPLDTRMLPKSKGNYRTVLALSGQVVAKVEGYYKA